MSVALLDDLLAGFTGGVDDALAPPTPAKAANSAKSEHSCGLRPALAVCEGLRMPANPIDHDGDDSADSQTFAAVRKPESGRQSEHPCGSSQDSQDSQGCPSHSTSDEGDATAAVGWMDADISRFIDRRARLMRWGWPEADAEKLADRLVQRDREQDVRVSCTDCQHYRPGRCGNHRRAGLTAPDVGRDLASLLQHCPGWETRDDPGAGRKSSDAPPHDRQVSFDSTVPHNSP